MPRSTEYRSVTPVISAFRNVLRGRPIIEGLRHADKLAARTQPHPTVPGGPYHRTSKIYYYTRDARRLVQPPIEIVSTRQIEGEGAAQAKPKLLTPGNAYMPDKE